MPRDRCVQKTIVETKKKTLKKLLNLIRILNIAVKSSHEATHVVYVCHKSANIDERVDRITAYEWTFLGTSEVYGKQHTKYTTIRYIYTGCPKTYVHKLMSR